MIVCLKYSCVPCVGKVFGFNKANVYNWIKKAQVKKIDTTFQNKSDTFTIEGINVDIRHYISILRRKNRYFPRKIETLRIVLEFFCGNTMPSA